MENRIKHKPTVGRKPPLATASMGVAWALAVAMMNVSPILSAQSPPAFEVASVKPHKYSKQTFGFPMFLPGGRFTTSVSL
jgi:hypothetical protein